MDDVVLEPAVMLDDTWQPVDGPEAPASGSATFSAGADDFGVSYSRSPTAEIEKRAREVVIAVAPASTSTQIRSDDRFRYIRADLGMNIIVPEGHLEELRFRATLAAAGQEAVVIDGFPGNEIEHKYLVEGKIRLTLKALHFIPVIGNVLPLDIELEPWEFHFGHLDRAKIQFNGPLSSVAEWRFTGEGLHDGIHTSIVVRVPLVARAMEAKVEADYCYDPGVFARARWRTDAKPVRIDW
jgi:hypothetical protein